MSGEAGISLPTASGRSSTSAASAASSSSLEAARRQVDEVQNIMKVNVEKVLERDGKLSQLEERAERLQVIIYLLVILLLFWVFLLIFPQFFPGIHLKLQ